MKSGMSLLTGMVAVFALSACAPAQNPSRNVAAVQDSSDSIIGGSEVASSDVVAQSVVGIYIMSEQLGIQNGEVVKAKSSSICTGTLISTNVVLTAAHCVVEGGQMILFFGKSLDAAAANQKSLVRGVSKVVYHKGFNLGKGKDVNDIALIQFEGGLPAGFKAASILTNAASLKSGATVVLAGYGVTTMEGDEDTDQGSGVLRQVPMKVDNAAFAPSEILFDQRDNKGACHGDSGGPAFTKSGTRLVVVGVTSRGYDADETLSSEAVKCTRYSIYTNVGAQSTWIQKTALPALRALKAGDMKGI
ncbi:MAG: trypsin-like serine protease [Bdellovibrionota bacterium]